ncbi:MAG TPA: TetR/AcrR family transcriptional regulator [Marmoricola sp.]|jgi:AcrR family transcriptional regulator|nr:TetR/AcrR family transcriptional regulator [Marmoricola sp.]
MSRIAQQRDSHLSRGEIAATALRQFDARSSEPTIRSLAVELKVAPTAIYHHYPSRAALFQAVVELVWDEATAGTLGRFPDPFTADPIDVLVAAGLSTRRAWLAHYRVARYMAATPEANRFVNETVGIMAFLFERLGLDGEDGAGAFHSYSSFMIGAVLFAADRKAANEQLSDASGIEWNPAYESPDRAGVGKATRLAFDDVMTLSVTDPARDEVFFEKGLRRMVEGFVA